MIKHLETVLALSLPLSLMHTHAPTHTLTCSLTHSHSHTHAHSYLYTINIIGACVGLVNSSLIVSENGGEVMACVVLQKPQVLMDESTFFLFTQDDTALGSNWKYVVFTNHCLHFSYEINFHIFFPIFLLSSILI